MSAVLGRPFLFPSSSYLVLLANPSRDVRNTGMEKQKMAKRRGGGVESCVFSVEKRGGERVSRERSTTSERKCKRKHSKEDNDPRNISKGTPTLL